MNYKSVALTIGFFAVFIGLFWAIVVVPDEHDRQRERNWNPTTTLHASGNTVLVTAHGFKSVTHQAVLTAFDDWKNLHQQHRVLDASVGISSFSDDSTDVTLIVTLDKNVEE